MSNIVHKFFIVVQPVFLCQLHHSAWSTTANDEAAQKTYQGLWSVAIAPAMTHQSWRIREESLLLRRAQFIFPFKNLIGIFVKRKQNNITELGI